MAMPVMGDMSMTTPWTVVGWSSKSRDWWSSSHKLTIKFGEGITKPDVCSMKRSQMAAMRVLIYVLLALR